MTKPSKKRVYDIYSVINPLYLLSKICGLSSVIITPKNFNQERIKTSLFGVIYTIFLISAIVITDICITVKYDELPNVGDRTRGVFLLELVTNSTVAVLGMGVSLMHHRKLMNAILFKITVFDELLNWRFVSTLRRNGRCIFIQILFLILFFMCVFLVDYLTVTNGEGNLCIWKIFLISSYLCNFIRVLTVTQYVNFVLLLKQKLQTLNNSIFLLTNSVNIGTEYNNQDILFKTTNFSETSQLNINFAENFKEKFQFWCKTYMHNGFKHAFKFSQNPDRLLRLRASRILYDLLTDTCHMINSMYGFQMLICTTGNFILTIIILSYGIKSLLSHDESKETYTLPVFNPLLWAAILFIMQICPMASCSAASNESENTVILIQKMLLFPENDPEIVAEFQLFLQQLKTRNIQFSAMGFFNINYKNLGTFVGGGVTLLLMVLQFQKVNNLF
ncbi:hypothetical protein L9F63_009814 [Diploptera punctata]|uniref:Gustatory receptor n=1 Tax=Diploptera punctata TaxID=6984 RepID=A0AAD8AKJ5_DIPPU|nr:hypothetical protein L9F63_009814 [Diploptera punctata]